MVGLSLRERLVRLRRTAACAGASEPGGGELARLEEELLGEPSEGLALKARLERLVAVASRGRPGLPPRRLEDLVDGQTVRNERGEFYLVEEDVHLEALQGDVPLTRLRAVDLGSVKILTGEPDLASFDLARAVFLDTETTGLAGGAGTAAFLVGVGFVEGERFRVRQYFMRDYHEEPALLAALAEDLRGVPHVVTFNGKMFDVPLLEARYRLNRQLFPLDGARHLDLLHPARRLWKLRLESCRLQSLETALLGLRRTSDLPGEEIPRVYFDYVRNRDPRALPRVLRHNRLDVVSLAALAALACQWVEEGWAEDPRDVYSLARVFERARLYERSEAEYRRALEGGPAPLRLASLLRLARRRKRAGDHEAAAALWQEAAEAGHLAALRELAVYHEHVRQDLAAALESVERALALLDRWGAARSWSAASEFRRRRERLLRKLGPR